MKSVLLVVSDGIIRGFWGSALQRAGYLTEYAPDVKEAYASLKNNSYDICAAEDCEGIPGFCEFLSVSRRETGLIYIASSYSEADRMRGYKFGADGVLSKPFPPAELTALCDAIYRRVSAGTERRGENVIISGKLSLDCRTKTVNAAGRGIPLTKKEYILLKALLEGRGEPVPISELAAKLGDSDAAGNIPVLVHRLRAKLAEHERIKAARGTGYMWETEEKAAPPELL